MAQSNTSADVIVVNVPTGVLVHWEEASRLLA